jgi:peptide/nickel transport system permease protein
MSVVPETVSWRRTSPADRLRAIASSEMTRYIIRRIGHLIIVVFVCSFLVFLFMQALGDPVRAMMPFGTSPERIKAIRESLGLNDPVWQQYVRFVVHAVQGDFGQSLYLRSDAFDAAVATLPKTFILVVPAVVIGVAVGLVVGIYAGMRPGTVADKLVVASAYLTVSLAEFWIALMLIYLLAVNAGVVATAGYGTDLRHLALPVFVLALRPFAHTVQVMRTNVIQESQLPYVMTARSKGLGETKVFVRHVLPNAVLPVLALALYDLSRLFVAGTVIEVVFTWPGMGRLAVDALNHGDIPLVEATVVLAAVIVAVLNLIGDLLTFRLDPRTRSVIGGKSR